MEQHDPSVHDPMAAAMAGMPPLLHNIEHGYATTMTHDMIVTQDPTTEIDHAHALYGAQPGHLDHHSHPHHPHQYQHHGLHHVPHHQQVGGLPPAAGRQTGMHHPSEHDTESEQDEESHKLTIASVDAAATKGDEAWTEDEEQELLRLVNDENYRRSRLGETSTKWAPIARFFSRTVKAVKRKYDKLANPDKEQQRKSRMLQKQAANNAAAAAAAAAQAQTAATADLLQIQGWGTDPTTLQYQQLSLDQASAAAAAAAAMQSGQPLTNEQVMAYYGQYYTSDPNISEGHDPNIQMVDPQLLAQMGYQHISSAAHMGGGAGGGGGGINPSSISMNGMGLIGTMNNNGNPFSGAPTPPNPRNDRVFWKQEEQHLLLRLVQDVTYRQQVLGMSELNWDTIAKHLGRGKRSVQRKYDNLKGALQANGGTLVLPANDGKKWSPEEVNELLRLVEDPLYRMEKLGVDKVDWRILGQHFGRSYESVSYKYSYVKNTGRTGAEGKPKHAKAKHDTSYKEMAIWALQQIGGSGTSGQICKMIETNPIYSLQLDHAIVSGKKTLQRWKHGVRSALNAFHMFEKTLHIYEGESVWNLVSEEVLNEQQAQQDKAARHKKVQMNGGDHNGVHDLEGGSGEEDVGLTGADASGGGGAKGLHTRRRGKRGGAPLGEFYQHEHFQGDPNLIISSPLNTQGKAKKRRKTKGQEQHEESMRLAAQAAAAAGHSLEYTPEQLAQAELFSQSGLMHYFDPNNNLTGAGGIDINMLNMPPDQLVMLQQQMAAAAGGQLPVLPLILPPGSLDANAVAGLEAAAAAVAGEGGEGNQGVGDAGAQQQQQQQQQHHAGPATGEELQPQSTAPGVDANNANNNNVTAPIGIEGNNTPSALVGGDTTNPHGPRDNPDQSGLTPEQQAARAHAQAQAAEHQRLVEHYVATTGGMLDGSTDPHHQNQQHHQQHQQHQLDPSQAGVVQGVQLGQPIAGTGGVVGLDMNGLPYDQYGQYQQYQQYPQYGEQQYGGQGNDYALQQHMYNLSQLPPQ